MHTGGENIRKQVDSTIAATGTEKNGRISISTILTLLVAAVFLPVLVFSAVMLHRNGEAQQAMLTTLAEATTASIAETLDRHIAGMETTLRVFSTSYSLENNELEGLHRRASQALADSGSYLVVADENLNLLVNTRVPFGTPLGRIVETHAAETALENNKSEVTNAYVGRATQRLVFNVMLPVKQAGKPDRLLLLSQTLDSLTSTLSSQNLRGGWNAVIVDGNGIVVASSFMSSDVGKPFFLTDTIAPTGATIHRTVEVEGREFEAVLSHSTLSDWQAIVWAPTSAVRGSVDRSLMVLGLGGLAITAIGVILAWLLGRQVTRSVRRLARDARRLGAGEHVEAADFPVTEIATVSQALAQASRERQTAENEIRFLMREVAHRSKNQLTVVSSIAKQTAKHSRTFAAFQDVFQKRIQGLARSTDLLVAGGVAGVELRALVEAQIEPFRPGAALRVEISGEPFRLSNHAAQTLGLALHEQATNAAKYGAFATTEGRLAISWKAEGEDLLFVWREYVPRLRKRPESRGFGTEVIERMMGGALSAQIERTLHKNGMEYRFVMPLKQLEPDAAHEDEDKDNE